MEMKEILSFVVLLIGAVVAYGAAKISPRIFKGENRDSVRDIAFIKLVGFAIALIGAVMLIVIKK